MFQCQCFGVQIALLLNIRMVIYQIRMLSSHGGIPIPFFSNGFLLVSIVSTDPFLIIIGLILYLSLITNEEKSPKRPSFRSCINVPNYPTPFFLSVLCRRKVQKFSIFKTFMHQTCHMLLRQRSILPLLGPQAIQDAKANSNCPKTTY